MSSPSSPLPPPRCFALVPCAGVGERAGVGGPKQYHPLAGQAVVAHTLAALAASPSIDRTLVVLAPGDAVFEQHVPHFDGWVARCGGASRAASVLAGLAELRQRGVRDHDWILVHDAARCLLRPDGVERLVLACRDDPVGGLLALPVADTLKTEADGRVHETIDRRGKWAAQTPQMFRLGALESALSRAGTGVTDEAGAMESVGQAPRLVSGDVENFKLTWPADFALAERLLASRGRVNVSAVAVRDVLHALEARLLDPASHVDPELDQLLADDFIEVGENGQVLDRSAVLGWLRAPGRPYFRLTDFTATPLATDLVLTRFKAHQLAVEVEKGASWRVGIWQRHGTGWALLHHQGTSIPASGLNRDRS